MGPRYPDGSANSYDLTRQVSLDSYGDSNYTSHDEDDSATHLLSRRSSHTLYWPRALLAKVASTFTWRRLRQTAIRRVKRLKKGQGRLSLWLRRFLLVAYAFFGSLLVITIVVGIFFPSYTKLPGHYQALKDRIENGWAVGSANPNQEKVFIAASIYDPGGALVSGDWAQNVLRLVHILGPDNVYLSIYENDSGEKALQALADLETRVPCNHTLRSEAHLDRDKLPLVTLPDGTQRTKRIAYLAEVRNRALRPLETAHLRFDKLLYLNDVMFRPVEAAQLLFLTHSDTTGNAQYRSACAVDFINPFKFYDTFATRDLDGYSMGVPFFPWFPAGGGDSTLEDLLADSDAVRVRSCWGGMVAFDATFFQNWRGEANAIRTAGSESPSNISAPYRFRAASDLWWDASECCLIHADIQHPDVTRAGVYINPYVRTAYDSRTLYWLWVSKRFEKLYTPVHFLVDLLVNLPHYNPRRDEVPWQRVEEVVWVDDHTKPNNGSWHKAQRLAQHDGFCGRRGLPVMKLEPTPGEKNWEFITPPPMRID